MNPSKKIPNYGFSLVSFPRLLFARKLIQCLRQNGTGNEGSTSLLTRLHTVFLIYLFNASDTFEVS